MPDAKKDEVTTEEFDAALEILVDEMSGAQILAAPGAYEVLSEALNNEAIDLARKTKEEEDEDDEED
jgi:hypothetical protein